MRPHWGSNSQPKYVSWPGIKLTTFWCMGWCSNQLIHLSRATIFILLIFPTFLKYFSVVSGMYLLTGLSFSVVKNYLEVSNHQQHHFYFTDKNKLLLGKLWWLLLLTEQCPNSLAQCGKPLCHLPMRRYYSLIPLKPRPNLDSFIQQICVSPHHGPGTVLCIRDRANQKGIPYPQGPYCQHSLFQTHYGFSNPWVLALPVPWL